MSFAVGQTIGGRYEIHGIAGGAGRSGMGTVYVCFDHHDNRVLALKTYQEGFFNDKALVDHFKRGALAWIELHRHPNLVHALGVHEIGDRLYLALEYIAPDEHRRNTLTHHLCDEVSLEQSLRWGIQFSDAMEHARQRGITPHRDVKPDNLMVAHDGTLKVSDFDLAGLVDLDVAIKSGTSPGAPGLTFVHVADGKYVAGTPPWMAPEQFEGVSDARSDVYAFGVVLFQLASGGRLPIRADGDRDWAAAHASERPEPLDSPLWPIVETCLAKRARDRFGGDDPARAFVELRAALVDAWQRAFPDRPAPEAAEGKALEARDHADRGVSLTALGLHREALEAFKRALVHEPDDAIVYLNAGVALAKMGDLVNAEKAYRKAIALDAGLAEAHNNHGLVLEKKGDLDAAEAAYRRAIALEPRLIAAYQNIGVLLSKAGRHDVAIALMREAVARDSTNAGYHYTLGVCLEQAEQPQDAVRCYQDAIRLRPRDAGYHYALGNGWRLLDDMGRAVGAWKDAAALDPTHAMCRFSLGLAHEQVGRLDDAYRYYREAIEGDPGAPSAYYNYGLMLAKCGLYGEGADAFEGFLAHITPDLEPHRAKAEEYVVSMRADEERSQEEIAEHPEAIYNRGRAYLNFGRLDEAREWLERAIDARPGYAAALTALGIYHEKLGSYAESAACHRRALESDPSDLLPWNNLGWVHYLAGEYEQALEAYARYVESAPPDHAQWVESAKSVVAEIREKMSQGSAPDTRVAPDDGHGAAAQATPAPDSGASLIDAVLDAFNSGDHDAGLAQLAEMARRTGTAEAHVLLAEEYASRAMFDEALDACFRALEFDPNDVRALVGIGRAFAGKGEFDSAVGHFGDLLEQYPNHPLLLCELGDAMRLAGDNARALEVYRQALAAEPKLATAHCHMGLALDALGQRKAAMKAYREAIGCDPRHEIAHYHLGLALETMGFTDLAAESFEAYLGCASSSHPAWTEHARAALAGSGDVRARTG